MLIDTALANKDLADLVAAIVRSHPRRTPERRAAASLYSALITTKTPAAARRALATFADTDTMETATALLYDIQGQSW